MRSRSIRSFQAAGLSGMVKTKASSDRTREPVNWTCPADKYPAGEWKPSEPASPVGGADADELTGTVDDAQRAATFGETRSDHGDPAGDERLSGWPPR
jgi:hypothetical protein